MHETQLAKTLSACNTACKDLEQDQKKGHLIANHSQVKSQVFTQIACWWGCMVTSNKGYL